MAASKIKQGLKVAMVTVLASLATFTHAELIISPATMVKTNEAIVNQPSTHTLTDASVTKLMQVLHINDMIEGVIAQQQQFAEAMNKLPTTLPSDESKKTTIFSRQIEKQIQQVFSKYSKVFGQQIDANQQRQDMTTAYVNAAKQRYTQAEVNALINFYDNPMGQQILHKQNQVNSDFLQAVLPKMAGDPEHLQQQLPKLQQDIERIFN